MPNTFYYILSSNPSKRAETFFHLLISKTARKLLTKFYNPLRTFNLDGTKLLMPLSHDLPLNRRIFPQFNTALARLAAAMAQKYPAMTVIDIGANIGDTVAVLRKTVACPILCVEGNERFLCCFRKNANQFTDVELEEAFVGPADESSQYVVESAGGGTARLEKTSGAGVVMRSMSQILQHHPRFHDTKFFKVDTDGFDTKIILSELEFFKRAKPAIYLEYDPYLYRNAGVDSFSLFESLRQIGYRSAMIFENWGDYLLTADLSNQTLMEDIHSYYFGRRGLRYCDICVFHQDDQDVAVASRMGELEFAARNRE